MPDIVLKIDITVCLKRTCRPNTRHNHTEKKIQTQTYIWNNPNPPHPHTTATTTTTSKYIRIYRTVTIAG